MTDFRSGFFVSNFRSSVYDRWRLRGDMDDERPHDHRCPLYDDPRSGDPCECSDWESYDADEEADRLWELRRLDDGKD